MHLLDTNNNVKKGTFMQNSHVKEFKKVIIVNINIIIIVIININIIHLFILISWFF